MATTNVNAEGPVDIHGSSRGYRIMMCAVLRLSQHTTQFDPTCLNICGVSERYKHLQDPENPHKQHCKCGGTRTMVCWHGVWSLCERALNATARKEWWTSFTFGLTPCLAEWRGRRKCVKWAGGARAAERRLAVFISVTDCRHCLHFLFLSPAVFWGINAPIFLFDVME